MTVPTTIVELAEYVLGFDLQLGLYRVQDDGHWLWLNPPGRGCSPHVYVTRMKTEAECVAKTIELLLQWDALSPANKRRAQFGWDGIDGKQSWL